MQGRQKDLEGEVEEKKEKKEKPIYIVAGWDDASSAFYYSLYK